MTSNIKELIGSLRETLVHYEARRLEILEYIHSKIGTGWTCDHCKYSTYHQFAIECADCGANFPLEHIIAFKLGATQSESSEHLEVARATIDEAFGPALEAYQSQGVDEAAVEKRLDEAREEGFQEGYAEGQDDANHASKDTFHALIAWLRKRDFLQPDDYPEGYTAADILDALNEHEENLVCLSKRAALKEG